MIHHRKLRNSFGYAFEGVWHAVVNNQNLRIHFIAGLFVAAIGLFLHVNAFEMGILGIMILLVIAAEMINT